MKKIIPDDAILVPEGAEKEFEGVIFDVYQWQQEMFDGSKETFEMLKRADTVTVIPIVGEQIIILEDEQPNRGMRMSFPGGRVDPEDPDTLSAAKRELKEETGYEFDNLKLVHVWQPHAKLEWFIYFYVAWSGRKVSDIHLDAGEKIKVKMLSFEGAKNLVTVNAGYLGESKEIFEKVSSLEELIALPEFTGNETSR